MSEVADAELQRMKVTFSASRFASQGFQFARSLNGVSLALIWACIAIARLATEMTDGSDIANGAAAIFAMPLLVLIPRSLGLLASRAISSWGLPSASIDRFVAEWLLGVVVLILAATLLTGIANVPAEVTAVLILVPAIMLWALETPTRYTSRFQVTPVGAVDTSQTKETWMAGMSPGERALAALFQSVTTRTAGFHTVRIDQDALSPASHFLMCILMFVGGSPGSAAGGVKTVTITVLLLAVVTTLRRRERVEAFSRTIGVELLRRAATLVILMWSAISAFTLILCYTERGTLLEVLFEVVSACGTVGLTSGDLTARLTEIGQAVIILAMFVGRLGPLTLLIALAGRMHSAQYEYPEEPVIIG